MKNITEQKKAEARVEARMYNSIMVKRYMSLEPKVKELIAKKEAKA